MHVKFNRAHANSTVSECECITNIGINACNDTVKHITVKCNRKWSTINKYNAENRITIPWKYLIIVSGNRKRIGVKLYQVLLVKRGFQ